MTAEPILLSLKNAAGDAVVMTGAIRDLAIQHPGRFAISVKAHGQEVLENNPYLVPPTPHARRIDVNYRSEMTGANRPGVQRHFLTAFHRIFSRALGVEVVPTLPRPELHIRSDEPIPPVPQNYWVIFPGWKNDLPVKAWEAQNWQVLVDTLAAWGIHCVQVGAKWGQNPVLAGVTNLIGKTGLRQLLALIQYSEGVICGITSGMHIAAALEKPCVVLGGGREPWWWEAYVNENEGFGPASGKIRVPHRYLHTIGALDCCLTKGCNARALKTSLRHSQADLCRKIVTRDGRPTSTCLDMISPAMVTDAVLSYYLERTLIPHSHPLQELVATVPPLADITKPLQILRADGTKLEIRSSNGPRAAPAPSKIPHLQALPSRPANVPDPVLDQPAIGGRITLCLLLYGDHDQLHRQCLDSILTTVPRDRVELRIGGNSLCQTTRQYLQLLHDRGDISVLNLHVDNRRKYPVMRELFRMPPLRTPWTIWFDDDTLCDIDPQWFTKMAAVAASEPNIVVGPAYRYRLTDAWRAWCAQGSWYSGRLWEVRNAKPTVTFPTGSCWMAPSEALIKLDIPDPRVGHNKGDVTIGCQFYQGGYRVCDFSRTKNIVNWSAAPRRGVTEAHPAES